MKFAPDSDVPCSNLETVGIAMSWDPENDQVHVGILHRLDDDVQMCHLLWHHIVKREKPEPGYFWADCEMFRGSEERHSNGLFFAVSVAEAARNPRIPYGFAFDVDCFRNDGSFRPMEVGKGLTCASFIIALFHSFGYPIMELSTWRMRVKDREWQEKMLNILSSRATVQHVRAATAYIGQFRYRPEEVAVAAVRSPPALTFDECLPIAAEILSVLKS